MTITTDSPIYQKAFEQYLRRGTPIEVSLKSMIKAMLKAETFAPFYIWQTQMDDRVRPSHADNEGQIFEWDNPPPTGHPGSAPRCRCSAGSAPAFLNDPIFKRPNGVPRHWIIELSKKGDGIKYIDPKNIHNEVRIQKGNPDAHFPSQRQDYVKWKRQGQPLDKDGRPVPGDSPEAHIPIGEFVFKPELFK
ncbi:MAG: minor capsid protein [Rickettsiales bacterium]|nr:minor capsid protein [Rickettsiales bacterium]